MNAKETESRLRSYLTAREIPVLDFRGSLPVHPALKYGRVPMEKRRGICFHHAAAWGTIVGAAQSHIKERGFPGLAYGMIVDADGAVGITWDLDVKTYSQGDADKPGDENEQYIGVLVNGFFRSPGYDTANGAGEPTVPQLRTVLSLIEFARANDLPDIRGHYHFGKPACPGATIQAIIESVRYHRPVIENYDFNTVQGRQAALKDLGLYQGDIDGIWGFDSRNALLSFQKKAGITVDGYWGPQSQTAVATALLKRGKL
jgi:hypothetical protein